MRTGGARAAPGARPVRATRLLGERAGEKRLAGAQVPEPIDSHASLRSVITMTDLSDHDGAIVVITMAGIRNRSRRILFAEISGTFTMYREGVRRF